jgi:LacI family transcriptional regulator
MATITLADVAKAAGVSKSAVSKVLLGGGGKTTVVGDKTARRVRLAARRLRYRPNRIAQQLVRRRSDIIGVVLDSQCCALYNNIVAAIQFDTYRIGRRVQVGLVHDSFDAIRGYVDDMLGYGIQNVICLAHAYNDFGADVPPLFSEFENVLFVNPPMAESPFGFVSPDYYGNFRLLADHLLRLGRRRVVYAKTAYDSLDCRQRARALRDAYAAFGVPFEEGFVYGEPLREIDTRELAERFLADVLPLAPDALIIGNSIAIAWCIRLLAERGLRVPEDIAIAGMDAWPGCQALMPSITAIDNHFAVVAHRAVELICRPEGERPAVREYIPGSLVVGASCGAAPE